MKSRFDDAAEVFSSDGQKIGQLQAIESELLLVYHNGLLNEEQFRIPKSAVVEGESTAGQIRLSLSKEQLLHGREIAEGRPNSELVHGEKSGQKMGIGKQKVRYEPAALGEDNSQGGASSPVAIEQTPAKYSVPSGFSCDMCGATFEDSESLDAHRSGFHKGPTGV